MPSVKKMGNRFQVTVQCKAVRKKPWYYSFETYEEAMAYGVKLEGLLRSGHIPADLPIDDVVQPDTIEAIIRHYMLNAHLKEGDIQNLNTIIARYGATKLVKVNHAWIDEWLTSMKREFNLSPPTIRHYVGALARCFDWSVRKGNAHMAVNPLRLLPRGYSNYNKADLQFFKENEDLGLVAKSTVERERRLEPGEEEKIRAVMNKEIPEGRQRAFQLKHQAAIECMFDIAVETAMRLREIYRLELSAVNFEERTIFVKKAKSSNPNDKRSRQVPMSSPCMRAIETYLGHVTHQTRGMQGWNFENGALFPWWDGIQWGKNAAEQVYLQGVSNTLTRQFERIFEAAGCPDLNFHDLRHEATSRFFERTNLSDFEIMKITGHSSIKMLARYANLRGSKLAKRLW